MEYCFTAYKDRNALNTSKYSKNYFQLRSFETIVSFGFTIISFCEKSGIVADA